MNTAFLARISAIALSGALVAAVPCLAQPATGTTSGPAAGTPAENSMPATPHQSKVLRKHARTHKVQPAAADAKHVKGSTDTESGRAPKAQ